MRLLFKPEWPPAWVPEWRLRREVTVLTATMALGYDEEQIRLGALADDRVLLAFGTGEEFLGPHTDMPSAIAGGCRDVLQAAGRLARCMDLLEPGVEPPEGSVRFRLEADGAQYGGTYDLVALNRNQLPLAPLWHAFGGMAQPLLAALFAPWKTPQGAIPGLDRARRLWG